MLFLSIFGLLVNTYCELTCASTPTNVCMHHPITMTRPVVRGGVASTNHMISTAGTGQHEVADNLYDVTGGLSVGGVPVWSSRAVQ